MKDGVTTKITETRGGGKGNPRKNITVFNKEFL
jgi:hypothetical protein